MTRLVVLVVGIYFGWESLPISIVVVPYTIGTARTARKNEFGENCFSFFSLAAYFVQIIRYVCSLMRNPAAAPAGSQIFRTLHSEWNEGKKKIDHHHICRIRQYYIRFFLRGAGGFCVGFNILIYIKSYTPSTFPIYTMYIYEKRIYWKVTCGGCGTVS